MELSDARSRAEQYLDAEIRHEHDHAIVIARLREFEHVFAFGYNTKIFLDTGAVVHSLAGNGPVVVPKDGGEIYLALTALPLREQLGAVLHESECYPLEP